MAYDRESLLELSRRLEAELPSENSGKALRRSLYLPLARALAGAVHGMHDHIDWRTKQLFPQTCDDDVLENLHAPLWLGITGGRKAAVAATGKVIIKGIVGAIIEPETLLNRNDGQVFVVKDGAEIPISGSVAVAVIAQEAGVAGNTAAGVELSLVNPIAGVETVCAVVMIDGGSDIESIDLLRERIVERRQNGADVGRTVDWVAWAKEYPGVTRVWAAPKLAGLGTITIYFMRDGDADPYPDQDAQRELENYLNRTGLPFGEIFCAAPKKRLLNPTIQIKPNTITTQAYCQAAIEALIKNHASPVKYDDDGYMPLPITGITIPRTHITQAISNSLGEYDHVLISPEDDVVCKVGELLELGEITWI